MPFSVSNAAALKLIAIVVPLSFAVGAKACSVAAVFPRAAIFCSSSWDSWMPRSCSALGTCRTHVARLLF